jgi:glutamyl-tRNA synthetase/nondiscriminating glutamyl-tRNA synthetase
VIDDELMAITHVIRGEDHISNTPRQVLVYEAFGWTPPAFAHLSLVLGPDHAPLSKRHGATSVAEFRSKGYLPEALVNYLALIGWGTGAEELMPAMDIAKRFRLEDVSHSAGVFDEDKLSWVNRHYLKAIPPARLAAESLPFLRDSGVLTGDVSADGHAWLEAVLPAVATSVDRLNQFPERLHTIFHFDASALLADEGMGRELGEANAAAVVRALAQVLETAGPLTDRERFRAAAAQVRERTGAKGKDLFHPIRLALTGAAEGPELDVLVPAVDRAAALPDDSGVRRVAPCRDRAEQVAALLPG